MTGARRPPACSEDRGPLSRPARGTTVRPSGTRALAGRLTEPSRRCELIYRPPLKNAPPPPPPKPPPAPPSPPPRPPPARPASLEIRLVALLVLAATGRAISSPAFRPLRIIVVLLPASPVTTAWCTC